MEKDIDVFEAKKADPRRHDIDMFSDFISKEMQSELERLLEEQDLMKKEISQLKNERNMLFNILQKKAQSTPQNYTDPYIKRNSLLIENSISYEIPEIPIHNEPKASVKYTDTMVQANIKNSDICEFSKQLFLQKIAQYKNPTFERASSVLRGAKSGDAMLSYFVNASGTRINTMAQELHQIREEINQIHRKRKQDSLNVLRSPR